jgi:hypothetical protein
MSAEPSSTAALFPTTMFPTMSAVPSKPLPHGETKAVQAEQRDDILDYALLLAVLKLLSA